jgi:hypothetical protein
VTTRLTLVPALGCAVVLALASPPAWAAGDVPAAAPKGKPKTIKLDEISVEGKIQKPQAFYILPRSNLNYTALDQLDSNVPKIRKAVKNDPF